MIVAKLCEGNRVYTAVSNNPASSANFNDWQDQLAAMLGPREIGLTYFGVPSSDWSYDFTNVRWNSSGAGAGALVFPLPLYAGQVITEIHLTIEVVTHGTGGDLKLMRRTRTPSGGSMPAVDTVATINADIWNGLTDATATEMSYTGLTYTLAANYNYWLYLTPRTAVVSKVHEAMIKAQFGN